MNPNIKNNKASRSLQAILAGADEIKNEAGVSEMVAESEKDEGTVKETEEKPEEDSEKPEETTDDDEVEEITEEEVESARDDAEEDEDEEEPEEITDDEDESEEVEDDESEDDSDDSEEDDEPIAEEDIEEITEEEVESARAEMEDEEEPEEITDDEEEPEEQPIEEAMDEETSSEDEDEDEPDEDATTEAVASLVKAGFVCSLDGKGKICVTACGEAAEACDCGSEECPECNPKKEDACVTLNPVTDEDKVEAEDVTCVQSGTQENPFYTVLIKGMPTAAICLEDQPNAEAIRAYFLSNEYPRKLASAMAKGGVKNVLDTQKARMFVAKAEQSELAQNMKAEAKAEFDKQIAEAVTKMAEKFANSVKLAVAGMNKNFFTEDNDLKAATYAAFTELGCNESVAYDKVNKVFAQADKYFDTVIAKAQELMGKSDEAFAEVAEMVANAGIASKPAKTFASALTEGNNPVIAGVMQDKKKVEASAESRIRTMRMFR